MASVLSSLHIYEEVVHVSKATLRRFGSGGVSSPCASFLSGGAFASGAIFGFFFTMTPLRAAFVGFLEGADVDFGGAAGTVSGAATGGGDFTVTLAATALYRAR